MRKRADVILVERGFFDSRAKAQAAIAAGGVTANGRVLTKASEMVEPQAAITAAAAHPYVSRGGLKLKAALDTFAIDARAAVCMDLGASTGGFCQVLLEEGAEKVYAVDVGHGQLHPTIARNPRIINLEGTDARALTPDIIGEPIDLLVSDVSFISLKLVLPSAMPFLKKGALLAVLVKPQFEAGRAHVKKGVVRDITIHEAVCADLTTFVENLGCEICGLIPSPIAGGDGNHEFLLGARYV